MSNATTMLETADLERLIERLEMEPTSASLDSPIRLGHFILHERLGEGGMGIVYRAARDGRPGFLAIKVVPALLATPSAVARMRREAELLSRLDLPGVVGIIESGVAMTELGEQPYIAMDLIKGEHIDEYTRRTNASPARVIHLIKDLCGIVGQAHSAGVIHRDIKPSNILIDEQGQIQVLDFGIARSTLSSDQHACITSTGAHLGTPKYMSPEQQRGEPAGPQADVYAIAKLASDLLDIAESNDAAPSRDEHVLNAIAWATRARADQRCPSAIALAEAFETSQTARYRMIPRTMLPLAAAAIVIAAAALGLGDARNASPAYQQGSSEIQQLLLTDAAIAETTRSSQGIARAHIDRVKTMTDAAIVQFAEPEPIASASRQLLDALGIECWARGMDNTASTFFDQAIIAAQREGLGSTDPKWHRQIQLQAEAQIRIGGLLEAIAIIDDATTSARADHTQPIGPAIASNVRSPLLRLWWTRAIAMDRLGDHSAAVDLLIRVLDAQLDGYPDHTDWLDSLDVLTQILVDMDRDDDARQVLVSHPVPMSIQDTRIHERHDRIRSSVDEKNTFQGR